MAGLGPGCKGQWKIGDAVMALLSGGGQAEYVTVPEGYLMPIPNDMTFIQAAAIPEAWLTAFQLLCYKFLSLLPPSECCLSLKSLFSVAPFTWVRIRYARPKS